MANFEKPFDMMCLLFLLHILVINSHGGLLHSDRLNHNRLPPHLICLSPGTWHLAIWHSGKGNLQNKVVVQLEILKKIMYEHNFETDFSKIAKRTCREKTS